MRKRVGDFFTSSTRVQWLFDSMPETCDLNAVDLAQVSATCKACWLLRWPVCMVRRECGARLGPREAGLLVKALKRPRAPLWRFARLCRYRGTALLVASLASSSVENRVLLFEAGAVDLLIGRCDCEALYALRCLVGDHDGPKAEAARLEIARSIFELDGIGAIATIVGNDSLVSESRCEAFRLAASLCEDFVDDKASSRDALPRELFLEKIDKDFVRTALDLAASHRAPVRERRHALAALSSMAGHTYSPELAVDVLDALGSNQTISTCARFLPWVDDGDEDERNGSEDAFDLLLSLLVTAVPRNDEDVATRSRAANIQRAPGAVEALVNHVRTGRERRFNDDDAYLTVANVAVCLLADVFQVNPMSSVDPDVDAALIDDPRALKLLAEVIPDLLMTLSEPPYHRSGDKVQARHAYWSAGDSCPGGECVNLLRVLARRGYHRDVRDAGAVPVLEAMDRFCRQYPKPDANVLPSSQQLPPVPCSLQYTWNASEVRLLVLDLFVDLYDTPVPELGPADLAAALTTTAFLVDLVDPSTLS